MPNVDRRIAPRKECSVPVRFRVITNGRPTETDVRYTNSATGGITHAHFGMLEGQAQNLSERGVYFVCREPIDVGQEVEMFFTMPGELTGRGPEKVRCKARIVHAEPLQGNQRLTGAGVTVKRFEALARPYSWSNRARGAATA